MGRDALENSPAVLNRLLELGKRVYIVSNNAVHTCMQIAEKARNFGFNVTENSILNAGSAAAKYLKEINFDKKVYVIGRNNLVAELENVNIRCVEPDTVSIDTRFYDVTPEILNLDAEVGAVIVNYDPNFHYAHLTKAANYLKDPNCLFMATSMDKLCPNHHDIILPAVAPLVRAIESCTQRKVMTMGKPSPHICESLFDTITPERTLMTGDNALTDILLGKNCGFQTLMVGSGVNKWDDIQRWKLSETPDDRLLIPDTFIQKLGDLLEWLP